MEKKEYLKPNAEYIVFYSEEEITAVMPSVDSFASEDPELDLGLSGGSGPEVDDLPEGWD